MLNPETIGIVVVLAVLLFGAKRLPELGKSVGQGIKEFKKGINEAGEPEETTAEKK